MSAVSGEAGNLVRNAASPPRLLYLSDTPVESTYHGSALIYRLLQNYPPDALLIAGLDIYSSRVDRRLPNVRYEEFHVKSKRLLRTRLHRLVATWLAITAAQQGKVSAVLGPFRPQAVLTVIHGYSWLTAAAFARERRLPLHVIVHDDWPAMAQLIGPVKAWLDDRFGEVYRQAASRFCVSPYMSEDYRRRYGVNGTVLYPSRAADTPCFDHRCGGVPRDRSFTVAFAGSLYPEYIRQLDVLNCVLRGLGGRLLLFGPFDHKSLSAWGMNTDGVEIGGLVRSAELVRRLRTNSDVLLLPMSFAARDAKVIALSFPSKLTDYTATGLPLLFWAPAHSSAVQWATSEPGVAAVETDAGGANLVALLTRLRDDLVWREQLAKNAVETGKRYFSPETVQAIFDAGISNL
jgi:glycosyltransferase involved in cell wall biosynthesis